MSATYAPGVLAGDRFAWQALAACRYTDPDLFFPDGDPSAPASIAQAAEAKQVCESCPVRRECTEFAAGEKHGIWGGITEAERQAGHRRSLRNRRAAA